MPDASYIDMGALVELLEALETIKDSSKIRDHIVGAWDSDLSEVEFCRSAFMDAPETPDSDYRKLIEELRSFQNPTREIGKFLDRVFRAPPTIEIYWSTSIKLIRIHDELEKIWDAWNGLEMRDKPEEIREDLFITLKSLGATSEDIARIKKKLDLPEYASRPLSIFRGEIMRLQKLREIKNVKEETRQQGEEGPE